MPASPSFREQVLALVAQIPSGRVMTYGQLALLAGHPGAARQVGSVLRGLPGDSDLPWQRVVNAQGRVSTYRVGLGEWQRSLLEAEGLSFSAAGQLDLVAAQWWPSDSARP
ncbi:MGMT family protein [Deinococcus lacus]|uniref:MGMT family protein n=1 Tax=Deinococcus lacus TaxID=392561 RepID=A0ABW1YBQ6_9DEIO